MQAYHNTTSPKHTDLGMKQLFSHPSPILKCCTLQYLCDLHNWNTYTALEHIFIPQQRKSELQGSFHRDANSPGASQLRHSTKTIINLKSSCSEWQGSYSFLVDSPHPTVIKGQVFLHCSSRNRAAQNISEDYTAGKHQAGRKACPGHITSWLAQTYLLMAQAPGCHRGAVTVCRLSHPTQARPRVYKPQSAPHTAAAAHQRPPRELHLLLSGKIKPSFITNA